MIISDSILHNMLRLFSPNGWMKAVWGEGKYSGGHQGHQTIPDHTPGDTPNNCPSECKILETNIALKGVCQEIVLYF